MRYKNSCAKRKSVTLLMLRGYSHIASIFLQARIFMKSFRRLVRTKIPCREIIHNRNARTKFSGFCCWCFLFTKITVIYTIFNFFFSLCPVCQVQNPRRVKMICHHLHRLCVQTCIHSRQLLRHHFVPHRRKRRQTQRITALHYHVPPRREL